MALNNSAASLLGIDEKAENQSMANSESAG